MEMMKTRNAARGRWRLTGDEGTGRAKRKCKKECLSRKESRVVISVVPRVEVMIGRGG